MPIKYNVQLFLKTLTANSTVKLATFFIKNQRRDFSYQFLVNEAEEIIGHPMKERQFFYRLRWLVKIGFLRLLPNDRVAYNPDFWPESQPKSFLKI